MSWTPEKISTLKKLWPEHSANEIAKKLGNISRNAVIGKANRLGLSKPPIPKVEKPKPINIAKYNHIARTPRYIGNTALKLDIDELEMEEANIEKKYKFMKMDDTDDVVVPISMRLSLHELSDDACKWPEGDPSKLETLSFCGHKTHDEQPYCKFHCKRAFLNWQNKK